MESPLSARGNAEAREGLVKRQRETEEDGVGFRAEEGAKAAVPAGEGNGALSRVTDKPGEQLLSEILSDFHVSENFFLFGGGPYSSAATSLQVLAAEEKERDGHLGGEGEEGTFECSSEENCGSPALSFSSRFRTKRPRVRLGVQLDQTFPWLADLPDVVVRSLSCATNHIALLTEGGQIFIYKIRQYPWQGEGFDTWLPLASVPGREFVHVEIKSLDFGDAPLDVLCDPAFEPRPFAPPSCAARASSGLGPCGAPAREAVGPQASGAASSRGDEPASDECDGSDMRPENAEMSRETAERKEKRRPESQDVVSLCRCVSREEDPTSLFALAALDRDGNLWLGSNAHCCCAERKLLSSLSCEPSASSFSSCSLPSSRASTSSPAGRTHEALPRVNGAVEGKCLSAVPGSGQHKEERQTDEEDRDGWREDESRRRFDCLSSPLTCTCGGRRPNEARTSENPENGDLRENIQDEKRTEREEREERDGQPTGCPIRFQHCPMRMESLRLPVSQGVQGGMEERGTCLFVSLAELTPVPPSPCPDASLWSVAASQGPKREGERREGALASPPFSCFPFFPPLRYAVLCQSRLYHKRYGLIIRGKTLSCRASPLPHVPAKVVCGSEADCGLLLFTNGIAYQWQATVSDLGKVVPGLRKVEGSLKDKRVVDVFGGQHGPPEFLSSALSSSAAGGGRVPGSFDFFLLDASSVLHEYNFNLGQVAVNAGTSTGTPNSAASSSGGGGAPAALSSSSGVGLSSFRRPRVPQPIECTPLCFDLLYSHPASDRRIPYRVENFPRLLAALPKSYLLFILSISSVSFEIVRDKYVFLSSNQTIMPLPLPEPPCPQSSASVGSSAAPGEPPDRVVRTSSHSSRPLNPNRLVPPARAPSSTSSETVSTSSVASASSSASSAFLAKCVEHFHYLRASEISLLYRAPRVPRAALQAARNREKEEQADVGTSPPSDSTPLAASLPDPAAAASPFCPVSPKGEAAVCSSPPSPLCPLSSSGSLEKNRSISVQAVGDFLLILRESGHLEAIQKSLFGLKVWRRGAGGQLLEVGGRRKESLHSVSKWHIQELLRLHGKLRVRQYVPSSLLTVAAQLSSSSLPPRLGREASPFSRGSLACPGLANELENAKNREVSDSLSLTPSSLEVYLRVLDLASSAPPFRLFAGGNYVILSRYRVQRSRSLAACLQREETGGLISASFAHRLAQTTLGRGQAEHSPALSGDSGHKTSDRGEDMQREHTSFTFHSPPLPVASGLCPCRGAQRARHRGAFPSSLLSALAFSPFFRREAQTERGTGKEEKPHEGIDALPEPLLLLAKDLWRHACAAAEENPRLFLRLADLQHILLSRGHAVLLRILKKQTQETEEKLERQERRQGRQQEKKRARPLTPARSSDENGDEEAGEERVRGDSSTGREEQMAESEAAEMEKVVGAFVSDLVAHFSLLYSTSGKNEDFESRRSSPGERGTRGAHAMWRKRRGDRGGDEEREEKKQRVTAGLALAQGNPGWRRQKHTERRRNKDGSRAFSRRGKAGSSAFPDEQASSTSVHASADERQRAAGRREAERREERNRREERSRRARERERRNNILDQARRRLLRMQLERRRRQQNEEAIEEEQEGNRQGRRGQDEVDLDRKDDEQKESPPSTTDRKDEAVEEPVLEMAARAAGQTHKEDAPREQEGDVKEMGGSETKPAREGETQTE
ncbi:hypothetical protein TGMAS_231980 [Toxoplasma gondii MAS]|uniref:Uncharacterized protein n=1 Tax=Toxoplasma gondii MAS TaxID=943118 RepID=A0A086QXP9_TOXGO|nr:hypothetical protein TGMAS_231980 [Toxoplasma gondii MAS]